MKPQQIASSLTIPFAIISIVVMSLLTPLNNASANVVGVDSQNFNPTTSGLDFVTVHSSQTLKTGVLNFGLFLNYASNTLPIYEPSTASTSFQPEDSLLSADFNFGLGLSENWDMGISLPNVLSQDVKENNVVLQGLFEATGLNEIRVNSKYRLWNNDHHGLAVIGSVNFFLIKDFPYTGQDPGPTYNVEMAYDYRTGPWVFAANLGYRFRNPGEPITSPAGLPLPLGDQWLASTAASYYMESMDLKLIGEIYSSYPTEDTLDSTDRQLSTTELLLGAKWDVRYDLAAHLGAATELVHATASPDVRVYGGINYNFGPLFENKKSSLVNSFTTGLPNVDGFFFADGRGLFRGEKLANGQEKFIAKNVLFEFNGSKVNKEFYKELKKLARYAQSGKGFKSLSVVGHTDSVGKASYNQKLSVKRASAVQEVLRLYLKKNETSRVKASGMGETQPVASNANYQGRALNRRVEFILQR